MIGTVSISQLTRSLRLHPTESSRVRVRAFPLRFSATGLGFRFCRHPPPPNNSFKPTPHRGVNSVLCATLHAVATPLRGGLTLALGGRKAFCNWVVRNGDSSAPVGVLFGCVLSALPLRLHPSTRSRITCVSFTGFGNGDWLAVSPSLQMLSLLTGPAESSQVRAQTSGLRFSAGSQQLHSRRLPSRLTSRSSRPHIVASTACFALRCTLLPPRRGAA